VSKKALGRGLEALIGNEPVVKDTGIQEVDLERISPNPDQPRKDFEIEGIAELASSIKMHGLLQPILIRPVNNDYIIVAGERRFRAAQIAGLSKIPCIVQNCSDQEMAERALIENIQRSNLSPIEEGMAYARLIREYALTQDQVSERVGKGRPTIANLLRVIQLPERVLQLIRENKLSLGHAKVLLSIKDSSLQVLLAEKVAKDNLSVRDLETLILKFSERTESKTTNRKTHPLFLQVEDKLRSSFQTKVRVRGDSGRGKIEIEYFSEEELNRLLELWNIDIE
jgi:ParB family transcriptional regulator, chromosome partitioning protein